MLKVHTEKLGKVIVLHFQGRIVNGVAPTILREAMLERAETGAVILDFAQVELIDAGGLRVLLEVRQWTETKGIEFRLMNVNNLVQQVLEITRLDTVFEMSPRESAQPAGRGVGQPDNHEECPCSARASPGEC